MMSPMKKTSPQTTRTPMTISMPLLSEVGCDIRPAVLAVHAGADGFTNTPALVEESNLDVSHAQPDCYVVASRQQGDIPGEGCSGDFARTNHEAVVGC